MRPKYLELSEGGFSRKEDMLWSRLESCDLCGNSCGVNRINGVRGRCGSGLKVKVSSVSPHFGEESPLVGKNGSGTVFLSNCPISCVYCQNWQISQLGSGEEKTAEGLADMMLGLQRRGCHNINWVTPTQYVPQLVKSLRIASNKGLELPIVYNTGGYDRPEVIEGLDSIIDIYMPDVKYGGNSNSEKYSEAKGYWDVVRDNLKEMHRQVGDLKINDNGVAERGLLIRHLVLPNGIAESERVLRFIAEEISGDSYVNIMDQYYPAYKASDYSEIDRRITGEEFKEVIVVARKLGLNRGF